MSVFGRFFRSRTRPPNEAEAQTRIKDWTRASLALPEDATVAVNEIVCADPACPGMETVILVMERGRETRAFKVGKAIEEVDEADVATVLSSVDPA